MVSHILYIKENADNAMVYNKKLMLCLVGVNENGGNGMRFEL